MNPEKTNNHDETLHLLQAPVTIIGTAFDGRRAGLTAAWLTRISLDPPRIAVAVSPLRHSHGLLRQAQQFTVSILQESQVSEARLFGLKSGRDLDKWEEVEHVLRGDGMPALRFCAGRLLCRICEIYSEGDHDLFTADVIESELVAGRPVLPMRGEDYKP